MSYIKNPCFNSNLCRNKNLKMNKNPPCISVSQYCFQSQQFVINVIIKCQLWIMIHFPCYSLFLDIIRYFSLSFLRARVRKECCSPWVARSTARWAFLYFAFPGLISTVSSATSCILNAGVYHLGQDCQNISFGPTHKFFGIFSWI